MILRAFLPPLSRCLVVGVALCALSACSGAQSPCYLVNGAEARRLLGPGTILLDARPREPEPVVRLDGAIAVPRAEFSYRLKNLDARSRIVVFAESRGRAYDAAEELRKYGFTVYELGTIADWKARESKCD